MSAIVKRSEALPELRVEVARTILAECRRIDEAKDIRDKASAIAAYRRQEKASREAQNDAAEIKVRAERRIGELLKEARAKGERAARGRPVKTAQREPISPPPTLEQLGIERTAAQRYQKVAEIPEAKFERIIEAARAEPDGEITTAALLQEAKRKNPHAASRVNSEDVGDRRFTPRVLVQTLHAGFRFTVDAASEDGTPAAEIIGRHWTREDDGLEQSWRGERVFVNSPWSVLGEWVANTHREVTEGGCELVVHVMPGNRTEQYWWQRYIEPYRPDRGGSGVRVRCLDGRVNYGTPDDPEGEGEHGVGFPSVVVIWEGPRKRSSEFPPEDGDAGLDQELARDFAEQTSREFPFAGVLRAAVADAGPVAPAQRLLPAGEVVDAAPVSPPAKVGPCDPPLGAHRWVRKNPQAKGSDAVYACENCDAKMSHDLAAPAKGVDADPVAPVYPPDIPFAGLLDEDLPEDHDKLIWRRLRKYPATAHAFAGVGISLCNDYGVEDLIPARAEDVRCQECERIAKSSELEDLVEPVCRECGCSDHNACVPPCSWVVEPADGKPGLCSSCAAKAAGSPLAAKKPAAPPFLAKAILAYRCGLDVCPWCGADRKTNNPEKGGGWSLGGTNDAGEIGLSTCSRRQCQKPQVYVDAKHRRAWMKATNLSHQERERMFKAQLAKLEAAKPAGDADPVAPQRPPRTRASKVALAPPGVFPKAVSIKAGSLKHLLRLDGRRCEAISTGKGWGKGGPKRCGCGAQDAVRTKAGKLINVCRVHGQIAMRDLSLRIMEGK